MNVVRTKRQADSPARCTQGASNRQGRGKLANQHSAIDPGVIVIVQAIEDMLMLL